MSRDDATRTNTFTYKYLPVMLPYGSTVACYLPPGVTRTRTVPPRYRRLTAGYSTVRYRSVLAQQFTVVPYGIAVVRKIPQGG